MFLKELRGDRCRPNELRTVGNCGTWVRKMRGKNVRKPKRVDNVRENRRSIRLRREFLKDD